eukprot:TRINITY_DN4275_c0_g1_i1.p1 TRINITY_DN4275_c0_g1~~TRINITY_DN4275_c0_g1_i1.p1  ORF type:complete len:280 (-),score=69.99 TRINITY_DN4275_c0_g1_i1:142-981(-)
MTHSDELIFDEEEVDELENSLDLSFSILDDGLPVTPIKQSGNLRKTQPPLVSNVPRAPHFYIPDENPLDREIDRELSTVETEVEFSPFEIHNVRPLQQPPQYLNPLPSVSLLPSHSSPTTSHPIAVVNSTLPIPAPQQIQQEKVSRRNKTKKNGWTSQPTARHQEIEKEWKAALNRLDIDSPSISKYSAIFADHDYDFQSFIDTNEENLKEDLKDLGIEKKGHQRKILKLALDTKEKMLKAPTKNVSGFQWNTHAIAFGVVLVGALAIFGFAINRKNQS